MMLRLIAGLLAIFFWVGFAAAQSLSDHQGEWAASRAKCGKPAESIDDLRVEISRNGKTFKIGENVCKVLHLDKVRNNEFTVQASCNFGGDLERVLYRLKFTADSLTLWAAGISTHFTSCQPDASKKTNSEVKRDGKTLSTPSFVFAGRCHMDYCSFTNVTGAVSEIATPTGVLKRLLSVAKIVKAPEMPDGIPDYDKVLVPKFDGTPESRLAFHCSPERPFVAFAGSADKGWFIHELNLQAPASGASVDTLALYWNACHGVRIGADQIWDLDSSIEGKLVQKIMMCCRKAWTEEGLAQSELNDYDAVVKFANSYKQK
jgi:hypothetical protein